MHTQLLTPWANILRLGRWHARRKRDRAAAKKSLTPGGVSHRNTEISANSTYAS
jgi:hypothetical protein